MPRKRLKDTLKFVKTEEPRRSHMARIEDELPSKPDAVILATGGPLEVETRVVTSKLKASDVGKLTGKKFVDLLKLGHKPGKAAHQLHTTVQEMMQDKSVQAQVRKLIKDYTLDAETRKLFIRALQNKVMIEKADEDPKLALQAAQFAAEDPEVGLGKNAPPAVQIDVNLRNMLSEKVEPLPGLEAPPTPELGVVDVEFIEREEPGK